MTDTAVEDAIDMVLKPIQQFTRGWMLTRSTAERGVELGLASGEDFWICGRAGVLGECRPEVAAAGLAFIAPDAVASSWDSLPPGMTHGQIAEEYSRCCTDWGRTALAEFDPSRMDRLDTLGRRVAGSAPAALGSLFAGWRAMPTPDDVGARVALTTHVLREMRGAAHIIAIQACGLTPLDAVLASPAPPPRSGPGWAEHLSWTGPFRDPEEVRQARMEAEALTSSILRPYFGALVGDELDELTEVVVTTRAALDM